MYVRYTYIIMVYINNDPIPNNDHDPIRIGI